jgi:hypothetical protein
MLHVLERLMFRAAGGAGIEMGADLQHLRTGQFRIQICGQEVANPAAIHLLYLLSPARRRHPAQTFPGRPKPGCVL